jgi:hypothetical protein
MRTKPKVAALVVLLLGVAAVFHLQQLKIKRLEAENADFRTQLSQMASLQDTNLTTGHISRRTPELQKVCRLFGVVGHHVVDGTPH